MGYSISCTRRTLMYVTVTESRSYMSTDLSPYCLFLHLSRGTPAKIEYIFLSRPFSYCAVIFHLQFTWLLKICAHDCLIDNQMAKFELSGHYDIRALYRVLDGRVETSSERTWNNLEGGNNINCNFQ